MGRDYSVGEDLLVKRHVLERLSVVILGRGGGGGGAMLCPPPFPMFILSLGFLILLA